ncbi:hypothetical protein D9M68_609160 [compost metagenome]
MSTLMESALHDGLIERNPVKAIARPGTGQKVPAPFTREEAEVIDATLCLLAGMNPRSLRTS